MTFTFKKYRNYLKNKQPSHLIGTGHVNYAEIKLLTLKQNFHPQNTEKHFLVLHPRWCNQIGEVIKKFRIWKSKDNCAFLTNIFVIKKRRFEKKLYGALSRSEARVIFRLKSGYTET